MPFLCNIAPTHLDFLCRNDEKIRHQQSRLASRAHATSATGKRVNCGNPPREQGMLDVVLLAGGIGFFIISIAYAYGCDRL